MSRTERLQGGGQLPVDRCMVDTMVVVYAAQKRMGDKPKNPLHATQMADSESALKLLKPARISVLSYMETMRTTRPKEREKVADILREAYQLPLLPKATWTAFSIMEKRGSARKVCHVCLCADDSGPCKACGVNVAHQQRLVDVLIVGTAEFYEDIDVLLSFDKGILALQKYAKKRIMTPTDWLGDGLPILERIRDSDRNMAAEED